jgi:hypothetical protein
MIPSALQLIAVYLEERDGDVYLLWSTSTGGDEYILWANNHPITMRNDVTVSIHNALEDIDLHDPDSLERIYEMVKTPTMYSIGSGKTKTAYSAIPQKAKR